MNKRWITLCLLALACALLLAGCAGQTDAKYAPELLPAAGVASDICTVTRGENYTLSAHDAFVAPYVEELCFTVDGRVDQVLVRPGDAVKAGDALITLDLEAEKERVAELEEALLYQKTVNDYDNRLQEIDIAILEAELKALSGEDQAQKALKSLEIEQARLTLSQKKEMQALDLQSDETELAKLKETLLNDAIYAPFDGVIGRAIEVKKGGKVKAYDTLVYLADKTKLRVTCDYISEGSFKSAMGGMYALIGGEKYEIEHVEMDMSEYLSAILVGDAVYTDFAIVGPEGWQSKVSAGDYANVIFVNNYAEDALLIPANAVLSDSGGKYVYVVGENGERVKRDIRVRASTAAINAQVLEGLEEGERIYVTDK